MRILVTGGRHYSNREHVFGALDRVHRERGISLLIHGACPYGGTDQIAEDWALARGVPFRACPAPWREMRKRAGPYRNRQMINGSHPALRPGEKPEGVVAFPGGLGTRDCTTRASAARIPVWRPRPPAAPAA